MRTCLLPKHHTLISALYLDGFSLSEIVGATGRSLPAIRRALRLNGVTTRNPNKLSPNDIDAVVVRYVAGEPTTLIAPDFNVTHVALCAILRRRGLTRTASEARVGRAHKCATRYTCDGSYFDTIDTERKAYWLGFIAADGCVSLRETGRARLSISLNRSDASHLAAFLADINCNVPIRDTGKNCVGFVVTNDAITSALMAHGIIPRKTYRLEFPVTVPPSLIRHYIRGYFDGDGCISATGAGTLSFVGRNEFLAALRDTLNRHAFSQLKARGCLSTKNKRHPASGIGQLLWCGRAQLDAAYAYLYTDATRWLPRKHEKFRAILASYRVKSLARPCES